MYQGHKIDLYWVQCRHQQKAKQRQGKTGYWNDGDEYRSTEPFGITGELR